MKKVYFIYIVFLIVGCKSYVLTDVKNENISVTQSFSADSTLIHIIKPYKNSLDSSMNEVLAISELEMTTGSPEGLLGNFVCDLSLEIGNEYFEKIYKDKADFVILNNGGLRTFLPKGEVTRRKCYEIMPFENELVVVTLSAKNANELFGYIAKKSVKVGSRKQGVPISGNVKVLLNDKFPKDIYINESPFVGKQYKVITTDYLANGGDNMSFFKNPINRQKLGIKLRDAIILKCERENENGKKLIAELDKRISYVE